MCQPVDRAHPEGHLARCKLRIKDACTFHRGQEANKSKSMITGDKNFSKINLRNP